MQRNRAERFRRASFEFTYQVHIPANADPAGPTHLWIPLPQADGYQDIRSLHIDSPVSYSPRPRRRIRKHFCGLHAQAATIRNRFLTCCCDSPPCAAKHKVALDAAALQNASASASRNPNLQRYLEPDKTRSTERHHRRACQGNIPAVTAHRSKRLVTSTITSSLLCVMTNLAKAGAAVTPCGRALQSGAIAPISIPCSSA